MAGRWRAQTPFFFFGAAWRKKDGKRCDASGHRVTWTVSVFTPVEAMTPRETIEKRRPNPTPVVSREEMAVTTTTTDTDICCDATSARAMQANLPTEFMFPRPGEEPLRS